MYNCNRRKYDRSYSITCDFDRERKVPSQVELDETERFYDAFISPSNQDKRSPSDLEKEVQK